jgi:hypothetical protein
MSDDRLVFKMRSVIAELERENVKLQRRLLGNLVVIEDITSVACATAFGLALANPELDTSLVDMTDAQVNEAIRIRYDSLPKPKSGE